MNFVTHRMMVGNYKSAQQCLAQVGACAAVLGAAACRHGLGAAACSAPPAATRLTSPRAPQSIRSEGLLSVYTGVWPSVLGIIPFT